MLTCAAVAYILETIQSCHIIYSIVYHIYECDNKYIYILAMKNL